MIDKKLVDKLFKLVDKCEKTDDFPVAAIVFKEDKIISTAYNKRNKSQKTIDHAEIIAITKANKKTNKWRLSDLSMLVTLEPCDMCKTVINEARLNEVYFIIPRYKYKKQYDDVKYNYLESTTEKKEKYLSQIKSFFKEKR